MANPKEDMNISIADGISRLQVYYAETAKRRGWDEETAKETVLLLAEELGELARAVRKHEGMNRDHVYDVELGEELADVQLYLIHLANQTGVDLGAAVIAKEVTNEARFIQRKG
ncbi:MAG: MazG protein [Candidatus Saccharibacteria bacterium]|nr:MazG protein [Candidatus Saccharibacteria bacterium]